MEKTPGQIQYAKHRAKRLAEAKAKRDADPEAAKAYQRAMYAKHAEKRAAHARTYRAERREELAKKAKERYHNTTGDKKTAREARRKAYRKENNAAIYEKVQAWRKQNPEKELILHAKRLLNEQTGIKFSDIPLDLAEAKAMQIKVKRAVDELLGEMPA